MVEVESDCRCFHYQMPTPFRERARNFTGSQHSGARGGRKYPLLALYGRR
jgi:hypothetical protein